MLVAKNVPNGKIRAFFAKRNQITGKIRHFLINNIHFGESEALG